MKSWLMIGAAALQVVALAWMAGQREWVVRTGRTVYLRTAPLDPRDVMRGDYVRLAYEISRVPHDLWQGGLAAQPKTNDPLPRDTKLYASLRVDEGGLAQLVSLSDQPPDDRLFIRGRLEHLTALHAQVRYGIEAFFMEQGKAFDLEQGRLREGVQVQLEMEVAISPGGLAVLKRYRWSPLGIGLDLEITNDPQTNAVRLRRVTAARVRLLNAGSNDVAIVDLPRGRSFALLTDTQWGDDPWRWASVGDAPATPDATQIVVLKPGQFHTNRIAFSDPFWHVMKEGLTANTAEETKPIWDASQNWATRFRLVYQPPDAAACKALPKADLIWHGRLSSRAFDAQGGMD